MKNLSSRIRRRNLRIYQFRSTKSNTTRTRSFLWRLLLQSELIDTQDGNIIFHLQVFRDETHLNAVGSQLAFFFESLFFVTVFFFQSLAIHCNWLGMWTERFHRLFFSHIYAFSSLDTHRIVVQGVARRVCIKHVPPYLISCLSVWCSFVLSSSSVSDVSTFTLTSICSLLDTSTLMMSRTSSINSKAHSSKEEYYIVEIYDFLKRRWDTPSSQSTERSKTVYNS